MNYRQLALRYLKRQKSKVIILFFVLLFINSMILSISMILSATEDSKKNINKKANAKIVLEIINNNDMISDNDVTKIEKFDDVNFVNRLSIHIAQPVNFLPVVKNSEEDSLDISLLSYDDLKNDSDFSEQRFRLVSGKYINKEAPKGAVINSILAESNGLKIGDKLSLKTSHGNIDVDIIGLFTTGSERKQSSDMKAADRLENQIFIDNETMSQLFESNEFYKLIVYTKSPDTIKNLESDLKTILGDKVEFEVSDILYQQMKIPLDQIIRITKLILILTFITGIIVVSLLLCMWMRTRKKEIAVFISVGKSKLSITIQVFLEIFIVFILSLTGTGFLGNATANILQRILINSTTSEVTLNVFLKWENIATLFIIGGLIIFTSIMCSLIPVLIAKPKDTLSKMEG